MVYCNTGLDDEPKLIRTMAMFTMTGLPRIKRSAVSLKDDGFDAMQAHLLLPSRAKPFSKQGMMMTQAAIFDASSLKTKLQSKVRVWKKQAYVCATIITGTGNESLEEALVIAGIITEVAGTEGFPLFLELHRASVTESIERTLAMVTAYPKLTFTADFSHWILSYRIDELSAEKRLALLSKIAPVIERCGYLQLRYASSNHIQLSKGLASKHIQSVYHQLTGSVIRAFNANAINGDVLFIAPEVLPSFTGYSQLNLLSEEKGIEKYNRYDEARTILDAVIDSEQYANYEGSDDSDGGGDREKSEEQTFSPIISSLEDLQALQSQLSEGRVDATSIELAPQEALLNAFVQLQQQYPHCLLAVKRNTVTHTLMDTLAIIKAYPNIRLSLDVSEWILGSEITIDKLFKFHQQVMFLKLNVVEINDEVCTAEHRLSEPLTLRNIKPGFLISPGFFIEVIYRAYFQYVLKRYKG